MTRWRYDADENDPLTALRIPVTSDYPDFHYTACFDRESRQRPTDAEARMIASFIEEYQSRWFGDGAWRQEQLAKPFDMDCPTTTVFHKWAADDWSYRNRMWQAGPHWSPAGPRLRNTQYDTSRLKGPLSLLELMDAIARGTVWDRWKADHPDVFPAPPLPTEDKESRK